jgi:hypothetical protein
MNQGKGPESQTEPGRRGFHQEEASRGEKQLPLTIRCVRKARPDIMQGQFRKVGDNFLRRHPSCQVLQNVLDRDPQPTDTRFSTSLTRLHGDDFLIVHSPKVLELCHTSNSRRRIPPAGLLSLSKRDFLQPRELLLAPLHQDRRGNATNRLTAPSPPAAALGPSGSRC